MISLFPSLPDNFSASSIRKVGWYFSLSRNVTEGVSPIPLVVMGRWQRCFKHDIKVVFPLCFVADRMARIHAKSREATYQVVIAQRDAA